MINFKKFNSIISLTAYFNSDDKCKQAITEARWGVGNNQDVVRCLPLLWKTPLQDVQEWTLPLHRVQQKLFLSRWYYLREHQVTTYQVVRWNVPYLFS